MAVSRATSWRNKLDIAELLEEQVEWRWQKEEAGYFVGECPLCGHFGFKVKVKGGRWECPSDNCNWTTLPASGDIDALIAWQTCKPLAQVRQWLAKKAGHIFAGEAPLPQKSEIIGYQLRLQERYKNADEDNFKTYLERHAISKRVIEEYRIGIDDNGWLTFPVFDRDENIFNRKMISILADARKKNMVLKGHGHIAFPWKHINAWNPEKPIVITEGEPDAFCLLSLPGELNVCTTTGGTGTLTPKYIPYSLIPKNGVVILCVDNDDAGKKAKNKLLYSLKKHSQQIELRVIVLPEEYKDIADCMAAQPEDKRQLVWDELVNTAMVYSGQTFTHRGMYESEGCTMKSVKDEPYRLAPFTGQIIEWGTERKAGIEGRHGCKILATHYQGHSIEFRYTQGDDFKHIVEAEGGPGFNILSKKEGEEVYHYIAEKINQGSPAKRVDFGWQFGFPGKKFEKFYTPGVIFTPKGAKENTEMVMETELNFLSGLKLPHPDPAKVKAGVNMLWHSAYRSHVPQVSAPLLVTAIMAPVRRLLSPKEDPFMVFVRGQSQACKTTRAKVYQSMYGDYWDHQDLVGFQGTVKTIEHQVELAGDCFMVLDDLKMERFNEGDRKYLYQFLQNTAQGGGRDRMTREGRMMQAARSYCIKVITCEVLPMADQSLLGRSLIIDTPRIEPLAATWKKPHDTAEDNRKLLPYVLAGWLDHCMQWKESMGDKYQRLRRESEGTVRSVCLGESGEHYQRLPQIDRIINRLTMYTTYHFMFMEWCAEYGLGSVDIGILREEWDSIALPALLNTMMDALSEGGAANEFILAVESNLRAGRAVLLDEAVSQLAPDKAQNSAIKIGFIRPLDGKRRKIGDYAENVAHFKGSAVNCCIDSGVQTMPWYNSKTTDWVTIRQYLKDNNLATEKRSGRDGTFMILRPEVADRILTAISSHGAPSKYAEEIPE